MDPLSTLQRLGQGRLLEDLARAVSATAEEVVETGRPGRVTLTLTISTQSQGSGMAIISEAIGRTSPKRPSRGAAFYVRDGELFKDDPWSPKMQFREIDTSTGEVKSVDTQREERAV